MATTFTGFSHPQKNALQTDFREAQRLCVRAANSLLLTQGGDINRRSRELLQLTFHLSGRGNDFWDKVGPIKDTFLGFQLRSDRLTVNRDTSRPTGDPNSMEFAAFTKSSDRDSIFIRDVYFSRFQPDRAVILIHEYVHLRHPMNPGDGHPGGVVIMFDKEGDVGIDYDDAIKNPYCYQYFAEWLG